MKSIRPKDLDELIGQDDLKQKARIAIGAALQRGEPLPHTLQTSGSGGLGKTTFATILANEMYSHITHLSGPALRTVPELRLVLFQLKKNEVIHIDECHAMSRQVAEELLLVLEEGVLSIKADDCQIRIELPPFTLIASTTKPSALSAPLRQRFGLHFHFGFYAVEDLVEITRLMADGLGIEFEDEVCEAIARRALGIPRLCLRHAERVRDVTQAKGLEAAGLKELHYAMRLDGIDSLGLTPDHRHILAALDGVKPRGLSARSLSLLLGAELSTVTNVLEPTLVRLGLMVITPGGRKITAAGQEHLKSAARI